MPRLRIEGLERDLEVPAGEDVRKACKDNHVNVFWSTWARLLNCRGIGLCGACPVRVLEANGTLPPPTKHEARRLAHRPEDWRLACQLEVRSPLRIELFPMVPPVERLGEEAVRRARMDEDEREELFRRERDERLGARRREVEEFLETRKKRRSRLFGFFASKLKGSKQEKEEPGKKAKKPKKQGGGGLAGRFRPGGKKKGSDPKDKAGERGGGKGTEEGPGEHDKPARKGPKPKGGGFKLGGKKEKKKEQPVEGGAGKGGKGGAGGG